MAWYTQTYRSRLALIPLILVPAVLHYFVLKNLGVSEHSSILDTLISALMLTALALGIIMIFRYYTPLQNSALIRFAFVIAAAAIHTFTSVELMRTLAGDQDLYMQFLQRSVYTRFAITFLLLWAVDINQWYRRSVQLEEEKNKHHRETRELAREAELATLRQQLQPHFLFNALNSISSLVLNDPAKARDMIQQLSDFLRGTLRKDEKQFLSYHEELQQLQLYLGIEKIRFGERLQLKILEDPQCALAKLPPLILQPLVENAIKFGLNTVLPVVQIHISVTCESGWLRIRIENPFDIESATQFRGTGFGFNSIERRLYLLYGRNDLLEAHTEGDHFITQIKIPQ